MKKLFLVALTATTLISNINAYAGTVDPKKIGTKLANVLTSPSNKTFGKPALVASTATLLCTGGFLIYWFHPLKKQKAAKAFTLGLTGGITAGLLLTAATKCCKKCF